MLFCGNRPGSSVVEVAVAFGDDNLAVAEILLGIFLTADPCFGDVCRKDIVVVMVATTKATRRSLRLRYIWRALLWLDSLSNLITVIP